MGERVQRQVLKSNIYHCNLIFHFETPEIIRIILICLPCQHDLGFHLTCKGKKVCVEVNYTKNLSVAQWKTRTCYVRTHHKVMDLALPGLFSRQPCGRWSSVRSQCAFTDGLAPGQPPRIEKNISAATKNQQYPRQSRVFCSPRPGGSAQEPLLWVFQTWELQVPDGSHGCSAARERDEVCASRFAPCCVPHGYWHHTARIRHSQR